MKKVSLCGCDRDQGNNGRAARGRRRPGARARSTSQTGAPPGTPGARALPTFPRSQSALAGGEGGAGPAPGPLWGGVRAKTHPATSARKWRWPRGPRRPANLAPAPTEALLALKPGPRTRAGARGPTPGSGGSRPRPPAWSPSGRSAGLRPGPAPHGPPSHPGRLSGTWGRGRVRGGGAAGVGGSWSPEPRASPAAGRC